MLVLRSRLLRIDGGPLVLDRPGDRDAKEIWLLILLAATPFEHETGNGPNSQIDRLTTILNFIV